MSADSRISLNDEYAIGEGHALVDVLPALGRSSNTRRTFDKQMGHAIGCYGGSPPGSYDTEPYGSEIAV